MLLHIKFLYLFLQEIRVFNATSYIVIEAFFYDRNEIIFERHSQIEFLFPEAVIKDENGYLMVDLPVLMDMDDLISKLVLEGGVARLVQARGSGGS